MKHVLWIGFVLLIILLMRLIQVFGAETFKKDQTAKFTILLLEEPHRGKSYQRIVGFRGARFVMYAPLYPQFHYGDRLTISGKIKEVRGSGYQSSYILSFPSIVSQEERIFLPLAWFRKSVVSFVENTLNSRESGLLLGIVFGIRPSFEASFNQKLSDVGILHIIAASGMNVSMAGGFFMGLFTLFFRRKVAVFATLLGLMLYALTSGLAPSIVRASLMGAAMYSAQLFGRQMMPLYALLMSGYLMLVVSPHLVFDIGFQLSFAATLGLLLIGPLLGGLGILHRVGVRETIAAQLATLPILLANFGTYSLFSIVANALILWTIPIRMVLGAMSIGGIILFPLGVAVTYLTIPLLWYIQQIVEWFSMLPTFEIARFPWQMGASYYLLLVAFFMMIKKK